MTIRFTAVDPAGLLQALADSVAAIKRSNALTPVSVVVPTNATGVTARRFLGRQRLGSHPGVAALDMFTLDRLGEVIAGPLLAKSKRPVSAPVVELTVRAVLEADPGIFAPVRRHASTITALRELYEELRLSEPDACERLSAGSARGAAVARIASEVTARLSGAWYDRADLLRNAAALLREGARLPAAQHVVVLQPQPPRPAEVGLLEALAEVSDVEVVFSYSGEPHLDRALVDVAERLGVVPSVPASLGPVPDPDEIISVTDADEEVRVAVRSIVTAARDGVSLDRIALLWPTTQPYARLVEQQLNDAGVPWNGRPGTQTAERIVPRFLLDLLELDRRGLRRSAVFELLADINVRRSDGRSAPTSQWERVARAAGVASDDDWGRLRTYADRQRALAQPGVTAHRAVHAEELAAFVAELRTELGKPWQRRSWSEWSEWARLQVTTRLGTDLLTGRAEAERLASDHTMRVLDRLGHLDELGGGPVTRSEFRAVFAAEFEAAPGRLGRLGFGVTVGSLVGQNALDVDLVIIVGAAEGIMPPAPRIDPLISAGDRSLADLEPADAQVHRMHRQLLATLRTVDRCIVTYPRGDLRGASERVRTRWLEATIPETTLASHHHALVHTEFPVSESEFRLRRNAAAAVSGPLTLERADPADRVLLASLEMRAARRSEAFTIYDGNLSGVTIPSFERPVSPSQIEAWPRCPHAYFQRYLLGVYPVDDPVLELAITPTERGNVVHDTLDRFHREVIAGLVPQPNPGWTDRHVSRAVEIFNEVTAQFERGGRTGRPAAWAIDRRKLLEDLFGWFEADSDRLSQRPATVVSSEARFGDDGNTTLDLLDGRHLAVKGSIDRIDQIADGLLVVDHKTGSSDPYRGLSAEDPTKGGTVFQLPVYAAGARTVAHQPGARVTAKYSMTKRGGYEQIGYEWTPTVEARVAQELSRIVAGIEFGVFPPAPTPPGFQMFVACQYCDPDGLGTDDRFAEVERKRSDELLAAWFGDDQPDDDSVSADGPVPGGSS